MRPVPRSRHLVAVMIFAAVAAASAYFVSLDDRLGAAQVNIASAAVKRHDPQTFQHDPIFGASQLWRFHTPAFQGLLELTLVPTGYQDLRLPFRALSGVIVMVTLCGMYALLYSQCRSWSVSAFVAIFSIRVIETLGGGSWGVGSMESVTPTTMCLALVPLIVLAFLRYSRPGAGSPVAAHWRLLLVFGVIGLMGNLHLVTAMNLTIVLLIVYVARQRFSPSCVPIALGCGLTALAGALPYAWYYFGLRWSMSRWDAPPSADVIAEAFRIGQVAVLYPDVLKSLLDWRLLIGGVALVVPAATVLMRVERFRARNLGVWVWFVAASLLTAFGLHGLSQLVGHVLHRGPPVIDFLQASSLVMPPLLVLLAQGLTNLFRLFRAHRALVRWGCAALMATWLVPSDNLRVPRYAALDLATAFVDDADKPDYVLRHREQDDRQRELEAIASWAAGRDGSIYVTDRSEFRLLARRPIVAGAGDVRYLYYLAPGRLGKWKDVFKAQQELLKTGDAEAWGRFVAGLIESDADLKQIRQWYVILRAGTGGAKTGTLRPIPSPSWGQHYTLCRVR